MRTPDRDCYVCSKSATNAIQLNKHTQKNRHEKCAINNYNVENCFVLFCFRYHYELAKSILLTFTRDCEFVTENRKTSMTECRPLSVDGIKSAVLNI